MRGLLTWTTSRPAASPGAGLRRRRGHGPRSQPAHGCAHPFWRACRCSMRETAGQPAACDRCGCSRAAARSRCALWLASQVLRPRCCEHWCLCCLSWRRPPMMRACSSRRWTGGTRAAASTAPTARTPHPQPDARPGLRAFARTSESCTRVCSGGWGVLLLLPTCNHIAIAAALLPTFSATTPRALHPALVPVAVPQVLLAGPS